MVEVKTYHLKPTELIPNSPYVLIHYPALLLKEVKRNDFNATDVHDIFTSNGWPVQWVAKYGPTQTSHYHSAAHECMAVISGEGATIRFGVADTSSDEEANTHGSGYEDGGVEVQARLGDVFVIPAGVAHKTHDPKPEGAIFKFHDAKGADSRKIVEKIELDGEFMMIGAYPSGDSWDFAVGGDHEGQYDNVWSVSKPEKDPVLGTSKDGLCGLWGERSCL
ncbi:hypothetical protein K505DRAFT_324338 [Melanomma pulvis-pyrius CBS 109.77]|uniref:Uncharacterized protein n=1 Tax=Melanomma pulvis-pyrius CBS 109.77 TaxID=1314802 RepID=A0A6A6XFI7_9PLEO|nr:hypothetical protein K505DRAFT_324338 [Melanomma pulvis-pyrius CBS 109.77]